MPDGAPADLNKITRLDLDDIRFRNPDRGRRAECRCLQGIADPGWKGRRPVHDVSGDRKRHPEGAVTGDEVIRTSIIGNAWDHVGDSIPRAGGEREGEWFCNGYICGGRSHDDRIGSRRPWVRGSAPTFERSNPSDPKDIGTGASDDADMMIGCPA